jgi:hypothetical protein
MLNVKKRVWNPTLIQGMVNKIGLVLKSSLRIHHAMRHPRVPVCILNLPISWMGVEVETGGIPGLQDMPHTTHR